jgi:hypothetical protein
VVQVVEPELRDGFELSYVTQMYCCEIAAVLNLPMSGIGRR